MMWWPPGRLLRPGSLSCVFLSLTASSPEGDASDVGYLLAKHPERIQDFALPFGTAWVYYPQVSSQASTVVLQVEVDPVGLVRNRRFRTDGFALSAYVNDRPYTASSMLSVAIKRIFGTALKGRCQARPDLIDRIWSLEVTIAAIPSPDRAESLFGPLGWRVHSQTRSSLPHRCVLSGDHTISATLSHLYVLLPVLDGSKHYWVDTDEVDKLLAHGGTWLPTHPERDWIIRSYLAGQRSLAAEVTSRLDTEEEEQDQSGPDRPPLAVQRRSAIRKLLTEVGARRVIDVGCGEGTLIADLSDDPRIDQVVGMDVSASELAKAERRLRIAEMPDRRRQRISLVQSSLGYTDERLRDADAVVLSEVIEHLDLPKLADLDQTLFGLKPRNIIMTTPNAEYNQLFEHPGLRHPDHRFEWTRSEFESWATDLAHQCGYRVSFRAVGEVHPIHGSPTQLAWFEAIS